MKYTLILIFSTLLTHSLLAQSITVKGKVKNENGENASFATIQMKKDEVSYSTQASIEGSFSLKVKEKGIYTVTISAFNHKTLIQKLNVTADVTTNFELDVDAKNLDELLIEGEIDPFGVKQLKAVEEGNINHGKKTEAINTEESIDNKASKTARQTFAKVPGVNIWESDAAGLQLDIGGRGLDPRRSTNFNVRQNGYDISADALGYPESYYTPPLEAVKQIEVVRGAGALQYGTQFGGLVNFKMKKGDTSKTAIFNSQNTYGAYQFMSTFNSLEGKVGKLNYYTCYQYKQGDAWRDNSSFNSHTAFVNLNYQLTPKLSLGVDYSFLYYLTRQAGGLSDGQFEENAQQSFRERNWFRVNWHLMAINLDYQLSPKLNLYSKFFGLIASRTSLGLLSPTITDIGTTNFDNGGYRDLLSGQFRNVGNETRLVHTYDFIQKENTFLLGTRLYRGFTNFSQNLGSTSDDPDFDAVGTNDIQNDLLFLDVENGSRTLSDYNFPNVNVALFTENIVKITPSFSLIPGIRYEYIRTKSIGEASKYDDIGGGDVNITEVGDTNTKERHIILFGLGASLNLNKQLEAYTNLTKNYRAINFTDIQITSPTQTVDENTTDEKGYSFDIGLRKKNYKKVYFDLSFFYIRYNNRIGDIIEDGLRKRTNIGTANIWGLESYVDVNVLKLIGSSHSKHKLTAFLNAAVSKGIYKDVIESATSGLRSGNRVENLPLYNIKSGITYGYKNLKTSLQYTYVSSQFSDADNTTLVNDATNGVQGIIPSYQVLDFSAKYEFGKYVDLQFSLNNLTNTIYFTRRAAGYPGPGIIPAQGRTFFITLGVTL